MRNFLKWFLIITVITVALLFLTDTEYILKGIRVIYLTGHKTAFINDAKYFKNDTIPKSNNPQPWPFHTDYNTSKPTEKLSKTNNELGTIAFVVIKNDSLWFENYAENYAPHSQTNSFSVAKSITSALLGKAIKDGYFKNLNQPVGDFYSEFKKPQITVGDLSSMSSGLNWDESYFNPFGMTARAYFDDDLEKLILGLQVTEDPGKEFKYLSGNIELLAMTIQKAVKKPIAQYLNESFWQPMGFEQPATWQLDDGTNRLVKAYCCLATNARDLARFGKLYKDFGKWNGKQILDSTFVAKSIEPRFKESPEYGYGFWLSDHNGKKIFVMRGILGQYVITIPEDNLIIVRLGEQRGNYIGKPFTEDFYIYIEETYNMLANSR